MAASAHCSRRPARFLHTALAVLLLASLVAVPAGAVCPGDCNGDGTVTVGEIIQGVSIALGQSALTVCPRIDRDGNGTVSVGELIAAVNALLGGCPAEPTATATASHTATLTPPPTATPTITSSASPTVTDTPTVTPTPTATSNQPPVLPSASIYRTYPGFDIRVPITGTDPEGGAVQCTADTLPAGASFDPPSGVLSWTPTSDELGPFYVPFSCADDAVPPASVDGRLTFAVSALDACAMPTCDAATGCTSTLPPVTQPCCAGGPAARVAEPTAGCPEGRVLYIGRNAHAGFGRLQNCDVLSLRNFLQAGAEASFHIETRCVNTFNRVKVHARMDSNAAKHGLVFDIQQPPLFLDPGGPNRFATRYNLRFGVAGQGPFFDLEGAEANLVVTLTDSDGVTLSQQVRLRLTFTPVADLPDVDPTDLPTPTATPG